MARIVIAGFHHETNTFAPVKADFSAFEQADDWPGLCVDEEVFSALSGLRIPISGVIEVLQPRHELIPLLWCSATPSAQLTQEAFETICAMMIDRLARIEFIDGVFLDLHGAMVCEHLDDGEGELLNRIRAMVGPDVPIAVSLDLHANITDQMFSQASVIDCYRTYPHIDMLETGMRSAHQLEYLIDTHQSHYAFSAMRRTRFLIPHNWGSTLCDPCQTLYEKVDELARNTAHVITFASGFPLADIVEAGPVVLAYGDQKETVELAADQLHSDIEAAKSHFNGKVYSPEEGIELALEHVACNRTPVVIADTQDNPGGGGPGDTVGLLRAFINHQIQGVVMATILDPQAAKLAHEAGVGQSFSAALGEQSNMAGHRPLKGRFKVLALGNGRFTATGPMYRGAHMRLGLMARVLIEGVQVLLASKPVQVSDQSIFRHLGVEPAKQKIISLKSSVHFRNDFQSIAGVIMLVAAPGPVVANLKQLEYHNVPPSMIL